MGARTKVLVRGRVESIQTIRYVRCAQRSDLAKEAVDSYRELRE